MKNIKKFMPFRANFCRNMKEGWNTVTCVDYKSILLQTRKSPYGGKLIDEFMFGIPYKKGVILNYFTVQVGNVNGWTKQDNFEYSNIFVDETGDWHKLSELTMEDFAMIGLKRRVYIHHDKKGYPQVIKFAPVK